MVDTRRTPHGAVNSVNRATYKIWRGMIRRCRYPGCREWKWYGGRGIKVCDRWKYFVCFLEDMGTRPEGMSIDRFPNPDGNYEPGNCRWATDEQQSAGIRRPHREDRRYSVSELAPREQQVADGIARGLTSREIGAELGLSVHTVRSYAKSLYRHTQAHSKQAIALLVHSALKC